LKKGSVQKVAQIALYRPVRQTFSYSFDPSELEKLKPGVRVVVPLRNRMETGVFIAFGKSDIATKKIAAVIDEEPVFPEYLMNLAQWCADYYHAGLGEFLKAMGSNNYSEWVRNYYPVFNRKGLIIDMRNNRGGNIDSWILEKLLRKAWFYWQPRVGKPYWNMQYAFRGHMVVLCNELTASDGEAFTEGFRRLGMGKVIGTRTWGGEIWLSFGNWLADRGIASAAEYGVYGPEGKWLIEGHGVEPDIVVDNLPHSTFKGKDAQLEAAVKHLQELIRKDPRPIPQPPPYPDKSFKHRHKS